MGNIVTGVKGKPTYEKAVNYAMLLNTWETDNSIAFFNQMVKYDTTKEV